MTSSTLQPELLPVRAGARAADELLGEMIAALAHHPNSDPWLPASTLTILLGCSDRVIRKLAALSDGRILSGQKGYCLIDRATLPEIDHAAAWLKSQGQEMIRRSLAIQRRRHTHHAH